MEAKKAVYSVLHSGAELEGCKQDDDADNHHERLQHKTQTELRQVLSVHENLALEFTNFCVDFYSISLGFLTILQFSSMICQY